MKAERGEIDGVRGISRREVLKKAAIGAAVIGPAMTTMAQNRIANGQTVPTTFTITVVIVGNGTVNPPGPVTVPAGGSQLFTAYPAPGWEVDDGDIISGIASVDDGPGENQGSVYNVQSNCVLQIVFEPLTQNE
jgi:hypothetical protein